MRAKSGCLACWEWEKQRETGPTQGSDYLPLGWWSLGEEAPGAPGNWEDKAPTMGSRNSSIDMADVRGSQRVREEGMMAGWNPSY